MLRSFCSRPILVGATRAEIKECGMEQRPSTVAIRSAEDAIERVLEAERDALATVSLCQEQAARIVAEARLRARRIAERADARIDAMRAASQASVAAEVARLDAEAQALAARSVPAERQRRLEAAVDSLAARLTANTQ
ncbi:MAG: hypothetical protein ABIR56_03330 [Polaromonas sp.]